MDTRILAATHCDLEAAMREKQFRKDLFYRLNPLTIRVPSLRERLEDIPELVWHCLDCASGEIGVAMPSIRVEAMDFLRHQSWPGNVRELENVVQQALLLARDHPIGLAHVQEAHARANRPIGTSDQIIASYLAELLSQARQGKAANARARMMEDMDRELFAQAIQLSQGNQAKAARCLGVTRTTLREKLAHFGLRPTMSARPDRNGKHTGLAHALPSLFVAVHPAGPTTGSSSAITGSINQGINPGPGEQ